MSRENAIAVTGATGRVGHFVAQRLTGNLRPNLALTNVRVLSYS